MTSRRIISEEKTLLEKDDAHTFSPAANEKSNIAPAVPLNVILKLLGFTLAMFAGPILTYFLVLRLMASATIAGATAAVMANVVLISYVIVAFKDDQSEAQEAAEKEKKSR